MTSSLAEQQLSRLVAIMARLRDPDDGCPWDKEQNFASIAPYTIEEAYEVADSIAKGDWSALKDELGDLLLQVIFHSRMAEEEGLFDFSDVARSISDKMERRHPHIFGSVDAADSDTVVGNWEAIKAAERTEKGETGLLSGIALALPSLLRAYKLQKRAARAGFDWPDVSGARTKIDEELAEVKEAVVNADPVAVEEEVGDLLFAVVNYARHEGVEPEAALRLANRKFERRFRDMERANAGPLEGLDLNSLEMLWEEVKAKEKSGVKP